MLILTHSDVEKILDGRETENIEAVADAYRLHSAGRTVVPHSVFLRFPDQPQDRIIGLPAYRGGERPVAGMKWISSFPGNIERGRQRASAALLLNSLSTGHPEALIEGSVISARRTAASAALAARLLTRGRPRDGVALIGCGVINLEILHHLCAALPDLRTVTLYDRSSRRSARFAEQIATEFPALTVRRTDSAPAAMAAHRLVSFATTAGVPHIGLAAAQPGTVVLHISLRDLLPEALLQADNIVDDPDHVCRENTSLHLAENLTGNRDFINASIGELLTEDGRETDTGLDPERTVVFSPFGLGVLDLALAERVLEGARAKGLGVQVDDFLPS
ncbi:2,3-diaminopropionate biosynthesis protein SbnB [Streptomyces sp. NPDC005811]|uniref:2,3-diaminopropionate biosynthesis protein SbnB n=1 Tax=Streptomyces sp. NPDC005811 TaxID=3154565 RepID=UPI0033DB316C